MMAKLFAASTDSWEETRLAAAALMWLPEPGLRCLQERSVEGTGASLPSGQPGELKSDDSAQTSL